MEGFKCNQTQSNKTLLKIECNTALKARTNYMFCAGFFNANNITCHKMSGSIYYNIEKRWRKWVKADCLKWFTIF